MKALTSILLGTALSVSALGFAQQNKHEFSPHGKTGTTNSLRDSAHRSITTRFPKKWNGTKTQSNEERMLIPHQKRPLTAADNLKKTQKAAKQYLDSMVYIDYYNGETFKEEFTYDNSGNPIKFVWYQDEGYGWEAYYKYECTYDANGNMLSYIEFDMDYDGWTESRKEEYTYDGNGNMIKYIGYYWEDNGWEAYWKYEYTYDGNGNMIEHISYWYDNGWTEDRKEEYTYDGNGNMIKYISYWYDNDWIENWKDEYTYDGNGNMIEYIYSDWNGSDWIESSKGEYTYDGNGNMIEYIYSYWDGSDWRESSKYEYAYDGNGNRIGYIESYWDGDDWIGSYKQEYAYDGNGNQTEMIEYYQGEGGWTADWKEECTYNSAYSVNDLVFPLDMLDWDFPINNMLTERKGSGWDEWEEEWQDAWTEVYYWSDGGVGVVEAGLAPALWVYPNPTTGKITVKLSVVSSQLSVELFDVVGKQYSVGAKHVLPNEEIEIDISHLANGLYFLKVDGKTVKVVKQ
ncbi:MAG: T9SS type A sorting domain-containing protein [Lentimicrobiaceae bacterium]|nr:T9SS type A sorting domain-containing protein [Lentimicrobiaceae bacterium]